MFVDEIIETLDDFVPFPANDPMNDSESFLNHLMDAWKRVPGKNKAIPSIFRLMERYPHGDFGSPGPLVHALESDGNAEYVTELHHSLMRKPTPLTLWMYNRIINAEKDHRLIKDHIIRMRLFAKHPLTDAETREEAKDFINYQIKRLG